MTTTKKRVNVSLAAPLESILAKLAKRDQVPKATKAAELIRIGVEIEEDEYLDIIASERDKEKVKFVSNKKAWA